MTIKCDKEGLEAVKALGDVALKAGGNANLEFIVKLYNTIQLEEASENTETK